MITSWLDVLPAGLVHNMDSIVGANDPSGIALECARIDPERAQLYGLIAQEVLRKRSASSPNLIHEMDTGHVTAYDDGYYWCRECDWTCGAGGD